MKQGNRKSAKLAPVHPGEILREDFMVPLALSQNRLALELRVPLTRVADIVHERRNITADTAMRLGRYFDNSPRFWLNLQAAYDLDVCRRQDWSGDSARGTEENGLIACYFTSR